MPGVIVIEDDDRIRRSLLVALEDEGYAVRGAATAEEGLLAIRPTCYWST
jgi:two-component system response regulator RegX3